jgi:hypothetical protein
MIFVSLIILIICKALINDKLSEDFYQRISGIVLLLSAILSYNCLFLKLDLTGLSSTNFSEGFAAVYEGLNYNINYYSGIGIYTGLFHISIITQVIEIFLLITGFIILISWPVQKEIIDEFVSLNHSESNPSPAQLPGGESKSFLYNLVHSIYLEGGAFNKFSQSLLLKRTEGSVQNRLSSNFIVYSILNNNKFISYPINYSIIVLFSTLGALLLVSCSDLISMYLSIELQSFSLYVLSTLYKDSELSTQAGLKYFLLGALSSCLILFGIGLIYAYTGLTNFESIYSFISIYSLEINNNYVQFIYPFLSKEFSQSIFLGLIFIFVGFLFKISAAPFHNWSPAKRSGKTLRWDKLSNSGDTLKLMVPSYSRKAISGWSNHSGMVTSQKIDEKKMGYRGSKSDFIMKSVKEQRVDGSYFSLSIHEKLRYTLMGFERNYRIKIPSKQLNISSFSTLSYQKIDKQNPSITSDTHVLNPWWITGFTMRSSRRMFSDSTSTRYETKT